VRCDHGGLARREAVADPDPGQNARTTEPPRAGDHPMNPAVPRIHPAWLIGAAGLLCAVQAAQAQDLPPPTLVECAAIAAAGDRLNCYDRLAGRAPAPERPAAQQAPLGEAPYAQDEPSRLLPKGAAARNPSRRHPYSVLSRYWELDPEDKRGVFNAVGYQSS